MRQYSADGINFSWLGVPNWEEGLAQGTFIRETKAAPQWTYKPNGYGGVVPMYNSNLSGALVVTFDRESAEHAKLTTFANLDLATRLIVAPILITDRSTRNVQVYTQAKIAGQANYSAGSGPSTVPWVFIYAQSIAQVFGLDNNVVNSGPFNVFG